MLLRFDPFRELDRAFDDGWRSPAPAPRSRWTPSATATVIVHQLRPARRRPRRRRPHRRAQRPHRHGRARRERPGGRPGPRRRAAQGRVQPPGAARRHARHRQARGRLRPRRPHRDDPGGRAGPAPQDQIGGGHQPEAIEAESVSQVLTPRPPGLLGGSPTAAAPCGVDARDGPDGRHRVHPHPDRGRQGRPGGDPRSATSTASCPPRTSPAPTT